MKCIYGPSRKFGKPRKRAATQVESEDDKSKMARTGAQIPPGSASMSYQNLQSQTHWDDLLQGNGSNSMLTPAWSGTSAGTGTGNGVSMSRWNPFSQPNSTDIGIHGPFGMAEDSGSSRPGNSTEDTVMLEPPAPSSYDLDDCFRYLPSAFDCFQDSPFSANQDNTVSLDQLPSTELPGSAIKSHESASTAAFQQTDAHNCDRLAYSTLESLEFRPEKLKLFHCSPAPNEPPTQSLDNVLSQNKTAINAVLELLNCSCSRDPHLVMLYASITSKILIWYQVAAGCTKSSSWGGVPPTSTTPSSTASNSSATGTMGSTRSCSVSSRPPLVKSAGSSVPPMLITLGSFDLDEKDQEAFRKYLLLSELKKLGQVIDIFGSLGTGKDSVGGVGDLYASLGGWLKSELARTVRVLKSGISEATDEIKDF